MTENQFKLRNFVLLLYYLLKNRKYVLHEHSVIIAFQGLSNS